MAKRFTDSEKYKKPFFRGLRGAYKLLWDYLYHDCDNAGIWIKDFEIAQLYIGSDMPVNEQEALKNFAQRVIPFDGGSKWFLPGFIEFQYDCTIETLNPKNNAHLSVLKKLTKLGLMSTSQGAMDKDKDKAMDEDKDKAKYNGFEENFKSAFDEIYLDQLAMKFKGIDLAKELTDFRFKCDSAPTEYHCRDRDGLRLGLLAQLKSSNGNGKEKNQIKWKV